jgi:ABC-type glycerol-3-phosphate transport system substrate-binding protein
MNTNERRSITLPGFGLLSILLVLAMSACARTPTPGPDGSPPEGSAVPDQSGVGETGETVVTFAGSEYERSLYEPLIEEFNQQNPSITVQFAPIPEPEPGEEPQDFNYTRMLVTTGDTSIMWGTWSLGDSGNIYFRDLGPLMDADPNFDVDDFWSGVLSACQDTDGRILGIPLSITFNGIFYDPEAFRTAGLPEPQPGWTWDEFRQTVTALARSEGGTPRYGFADRSYLYGSILAPLVDQHLVRHDGEIDAEALEKELKWYYDLGDAGAMYTPKQVENYGMDWEQWQAMFKSKDRPVMWGGYIMESLPGVEDMMYDPDNPYSMMAFNHDRFLPYPVSEDQAAANTTPVSVTCAAMSAGTTQPRAAWAWLSFLSEHRLIRNQTDAYELLQMPSRQSLAGSSGYWENLPAGLEEPLRYAVQHAWFGSLYPRSFEIVSQALGDSLTNGTSLVAAVDKAKAQMATNPTPTPDTAEIVIATPLPPPPADARVIDYYFENYGAPGSGSIKTVIENFTKEHPDIYVKLSREFTGPPEGQDYFEYITEKFDCLTWYTPSFQYQSPKGLLDLTALFEAEGPGFTQDFLSEQIEPFRWEGEILGLPAYSQPQIMAYNADLLARRGVEPPDEDWTFDDFIELASRVASTSASDPSYGYIYNQWENLIIAGRDVDWADLNADPPVAKFNSSEMVSALTWLVDLAKSNTLLVQTDDNWMTIEQAISEGRVAFWTAQAGNKSNYFYMPGQEDTMKIGVALMPAMPPSDEINYYSSNIGHFISKSSEDPQACWTWLKYVSEQPNLFPGVPARRSVAESPAWEAYVGAEDAAVYRLAQERTPPVTEPPAYNQTAWPFYQWRGVAITAILKGEDIKETLDEAQRKADVYSACIQGAAAPGVTEEKVQEQVTTCLKQADPQGNW